MDTPGKPVIGPAGLSAQVKQILIRSGFDKVGITSADSPQKSSLLNEWLSRGYHGSMEWMDRHAQKRADIGQLFPCARSVVSVAHNYFSSEPHQPGCAKISRYAWGEDYHKIIKKKLKQALAQIRELMPEANGRLCVDTAPFMDKLWAEKAGIGWQGKHTNIISREFGSWIFLGAIILDVELEPDLPAQDYCGQCTACIDACPTSAIVAPYLLDATKCISYLTIEYWDKPIPQPLSEQLDGWVFGCDVCQDVCPWNKFEQQTSEGRYRPKEGNVQPGFDELRQLGSEGYRERFKKSPVSRPGWENFLRNVNAADSGEK